MRVVLDAGPIIHLSWIDHLSILGALFDECLIPNAVRDEVLAASADMRGRVAIVAAFEREIVTVQSVEAASAITTVPLLGAGETEAIALAQQTSADLLASDDRAARDVATRLGLDVTGTIGILRDARVHGLILSVVPLLHDLRRHGQWLSPRLISRVEREEAEESR